MRDDIPAPRDTNPEAPNLHHCARSASGLRQKCASKRATNAPTVPEREQSGSSGQQPAESGTNGTNWRELLPLFVRAMEAGLELGERDYGDSTFRRPAQEVMAMAEDEVRDLAVYAFITWCRIRVLRDGTRELENRA